MPPDLEKIIPLMDEEGRALRIKAEHKLLNHVLKELDKDDLKPSEFRALVQSYCELKRRDNEREKITVAAAIAQLRESNRPAKRNHPARRLRLRDPQDAPLGASSDSSFGASPDSSLGTGYADEQSEHVEETDPDVDPEWSIAPWGRRKNGKPRTEKEYRTILYRAVRDVYGLDISRSFNDPPPDTCAAQTPPTSEQAPDATAGDGNANQPVSDHSQQHEFEPTGPPITPAQPVLLGPNADAAQDWPEPLPQREEPFLPRITNPWYYF